MNLFVLLFKYHSTCVGVWGHVDTSFILKRDNFSRAFWRVGSSLVNRTYEQEMTRIIVCLKQDGPYLCWGLNSRCFPMVGMVINLIVGFETYIISYYKDSLLKLGSQPQYKKLIDPGIFRGSLSFEKQLWREPWSSILTIQNHLVNHLFFIFVWSPWIHFTCTIFR